MFSSHKSRRIPLSAMIALSVGAGALLGGCGGERDPDTRVDRGIVAFAYGFVKDSEGNVGRVQNGVWQRPAIDVTPLTPAGEIDDYSACDITIPDGVVLDETRDGLCFVSGNDSVPACSISAGYSRYNAVLGSFAVTFVNNTTDKTHKLVVDGMGVNIRILNASGAQVWSFVDNNLDYQDLVEEAANLTLADSAGGCAGKVTAYSADANTLPRAALFGLPGAPRQFDLVAADSDTLAYTFAWDGKDADGNNVPAGTYTAYFDISVTDGVTGAAWEIPAPISFEIRD